MAAVEYAIEHDDGQSLRALDKADVILVAPSRCGKTPITMYLALQHRAFVANYPLVEEDFESTNLPRPVKNLGDRCFGLTTTPARLSQVRNERRPGGAFRRCRAGSARHFCRPRRLTYLTSLRGSSLSRPSIRPGPKPGVRRRCGCVGDHDGGEVARFGEG